MITNFSDPTAWLWRLDFGSDEPTKLLEVPAQEPLFADIPQSSMQSVGFMWISDSYAYFSCRDLVFRVDVRTGESKEVFFRYIIKASEKNYSLEKFENKTAVQLRPGLVAMLTLCELKRTWMRVRIIDEKSKRLLQQSSRLR